MEDGSLTTAGLVSYFLIEGSIRTWGEVRSNGIVFGGVGFKVGCHGIGMGGGVWVGGQKNLITGHIYHDIITTHLLSTNHILVGSCAKQSSVVECGLHNPQ